MADMGMTHASGGAGEKILDDIFEKVASLRVPAGANRLDLGLDFDASDGSPGVHIKLSVQADVQRGPAAMAGALVEEKAPEVVFGPKGHGAIMVIAMKDIEARRPDVKAKIDEILGNDPKSRTDYFTAANWADRVRLARPETRPWHYVDMLYDPRSPEATPALPDPPHVLSQLAAMSEELGRVDDPEAKADALCFVLHFIGDIHQPLHCITRVTPDFPAPKGDKGGNLFKISSHYRELHRLWDDSVNLMLQDSAEDLAVEIMQKHTRDNLARAIAVKEPESWARASFAIAVEHGYKPFEDGADGLPRPSSGYLRRARDIGQRQAALGGYRLADWLTRLLGD
jgi:S1/P1 Nuclease